jgi:hypothetical protein
VSRPAAAITTILGWPQLLWARMPPTRHLIAGNHRLQIRRQDMLKAWSVAIVLSFAAAGTQGLCSGLISSHKVDCSASFDVISAMKQTDKPSVYNKVAQCKIVY